MRAILLMLLCGFVLRAGAPAVADVPAPATPSADPTPIEVSSCTVAEHAAEVNPRIGFRNSSVDGVTIAYTNTAATAATNIRFRVVYRGATRYVVDRGLFPAGAKITRKFSSIDAVYGGDRATCGAVEATFVDGTRWTAPADTGPPHA